MMRAVRGTLTLIILAVAMWPGSASAKHVGDRADVGRPFDVQLKTESLYGVPRESSPVASTDAGDTPENHFETYIAGTDGTKIFVETWLPRPKDGNIPPEKLPTIVNISPYNFRGYSLSFGRQHFIPRGYAWVQVHLRGTGSSEGCVERHSAVDAADAALALEWIIDQPWSNGDLALVGGSYAGGAAINVAGRGGPVGRHIKAIAVHAPELSVYDSNWSFDGVRSALVATGSNGAYVANSAAWFPFFVPTPLDDFAKYLGDKIVTSISRSSCTDTFRRHMEVSTDPSGDVSDYYAQRDLRLDLDNITAPILVSHGYPDLNPYSGVPPVTQAGFFDQLPDSTVKVGVFGMFGHEGQQNTQLVGRRPDFWSMRIAWFDQWVKGIDSGVEWPTAQVQGSDGQWRAEPDWPTTGGPVGQLSLSSGGDLGSTSPAGSSTFTEDLVPLGTSHSTDRVLFETPPLEDRLELTGQPVLDLWVEADKPDAHIAAIIEVLDVNGNPKPREADRTNLTWGMRSLTHLEPLVGNRFVQKQPVPAPTSEAIRVPIRFQPTDLVVEEGEALRVTIADSLPVNAGGEMFFADFYDDPEAAPFLNAIDDPVCCPSEPSGNGTTINVLHDCEYPSALRFLMPRERSDLLNVRDAEPAGVPVEATDVPPLTSDGGGIATARVCGNSPSRILDVVPTLGDPYKPEAQLAVTPAVVQGSEDVSIHATVRSFFGAADIIDATVDIADRNGRLLHAWDRTTFSEAGDSLLLDASVPHLTGPSPWTITLTARDSNAQTVTSQQSLSR